MNPYFINFFIISRILCKTFKSTLLKKCKIYFCFLCRIGHRREMQPLVVSDNIFQLVNLRTVINCFQGVFFVVRILCFFSHLTPFSQKLYPSTRFLPGGIVSVYQDTIVEPYIAGGESIRSSLYDQGITKAARPRNQNLMSRAEIPSIRDIRIPRRPYRPLRGSLALCLCSI